MNGLRKPTAASPAADEVTIKINAVDVSVPAGLSVVAALMHVGRGCLRKNLVTGEPRTAFCGMGICGECAIEIDGVPQTRACLTPVKPGMHIVLEEVG